MDSSPWPPHHLLFILVITPLSFGEGHGGEAFLERKAVGFAHDLMEVHEGLSLPCVDEIDLIT
jgi:hypothetical protein